jgi:hypothetical protein
MDDLIEQIEAARRTINKGDVMGKLEHSLPAEVYESGMFATLRSDLESKVKELAAQLNIPAVEILGLALYTLCDTDFYSV